MDVPFRFAALLPLSFPCTSQSRACGGLSINCLSAGLLSCTVTRLDSAPIGGTLSLETLAAFKNFPFLPLREDTVVGHFREVSAASFGKSSGYNVLYTDI